MITEALCKLGEKSANVTVNSASIWFTYQAKEPRKPEKTISNKKNK